MKKIIETSEKAWESLLGKKVTVFCMNYIYYGEIVGDTDENILLKNPSIVFETGKFDSKEFEDIQSLETDEFFIQKSAIESFGVLKVKDD